MNDQVAQIDKYPFAGIFAFDTDDITACFANLVSYGCSQRFRLAIGSTGRNDDPFKKTGQF